MTRLYNFYARECRRAAASVEHWTRRAEYWRAMGSQEDEERCLGHAMHQSEYGFEVAINGARALTEYAHD